MNWNVRIYEKDLYLLGPAQKFHQHFLCKGELCLLMELKERALVNDSGNFLELRVVGIANQEALNGHTSHAVAMDKQGFVSAYELEGRSQEIVVLVHLPARSSRAV